MSLNSLIIQTLSPTGVPVDFQRYRGNDTTYITFFEYNDQGALYADDEEKRSRHSIQVKVSSKGNITSLVKQVHNLMISAGFTKNNYYDQYENDTETYHKVMRFYYITKTEEE
jgi:hypothetical protein